MVGPPPLPATVQLTFISSLISLQLFCSTFVSLVARYKWNNMIWCTLYPFLSTNLRYMLITSHQPAQTFLKKCFKHGNMPVLLVQCGRLRAKTEAAYWGTFVTGLVQYFCVFPTVLLCFVCICKLQGYLQKCARNEQRVWTQGSFCV